MSPDFRPRNPRAVPASSCACTFADGQAGGNLHGFLLSNGTFTTIDVPGAIFGTVAFGINPPGDIVGAYADSGDVHGFLLSKGKFTTIDPTGSHFYGGGWDQPARRHRRIL